MTSNDQPHLGRRELIRNGTITIALGGLLAACGADRGGSDAPGRIGYAPKPENDATDTTVDDAVILRTLQSLEYAVIEAEQQFLDMGAFGQDEDLAKRFIADHQEHAATVGDLISSIGGEPYDCPNVFFMDRAVDPALEAARDSDDVNRDAINSLYAFESLLGASYQALVPALTDGSLRSAVMAIGDDEQRHAAVTALTITPDPYNPEMVGGDAADAGEFGIPYAIPSTFAPLTGITLVVGRPVGEELKRTSISLQTPAENTFVYGYLSC